jgi:uncharacterized sulfatase
MHLVNDKVDLDPARSLFAQLKHGTAQFVSLSAALFAAFLAARIIELINLSLRGDISKDLRHVVVQALLFDSVFFLEMLPFLFVPFIALCLITRTARARHRIFAAGGMLLTVLYAALIKYFATALVPLGADLFGYSLKDIVTTIKGSEVFDRASLFLVLVPVAALWAGLAFLSSRRLIRPSGAFGILGAGIILSCTVSPLPPPSSFQTELSHSLALNKAAFFARQSYAYFFPRAQKDAVRAGTAVGRARLPKAALSFTYLDPEYPFLRTEDTPDVLGAFIKSEPSRPPNIVIILVEGLGKAFSGPHAYLGSFTPFLDELAGRGLYWENFLAAQGRTFAALPSILASLPFAEQGFNDLGRRMPRHLSLMSILKHNGYRVKFYFGSDLDFDNQRLFLQRQGVDVMVGMEDYEKKYSKSPGTSWGYADRDVMRKALEMEHHDQQQPYLTFVQTMSMHTSYSIPDQERYLALFEERMHDLGFDEARKEHYRAYKKIYSTILYTDEALRFFMEEYAKLPTYGNTLFIITGDHRLPEIPMSTKIDRFHVPLIIFSPLLKRTAHFESISSHLDITPSLLAFLKQNYALDTPATVSWVGSGLDTEPSFRNIHRYPLKHTKTNLIDYISGMYFLDQDRLFSLGKDMDLEPLQDEKIRNALVAEFDQYKAFNDRFTRELKLIPDSVYEPYRPR